MGPVEACAYVAMLSLFLYAGIVIAIVLVILAIPGVIQLLFDILFV